MRFPISVNSNWHSISYRFGVIAAYCSNFAPTRSLWLKISDRRGRPPPIIFAPIVRPMNALQLCPWQFSHRCYGWGATSENRSKIGDFAPMRSLIQNFRYKGSPPTHNFCTVSWANECLTTLPLTVFTQRNFVSDFLQAKCIFGGNRPFCVFETPFGGLRGNVRRSS